jgi:hypothetical protein
MNRVPDSIFAGHTNHIAIFLSFCRETLLKLGCRKYYPYYFTTAYTQETLEGMDRTRSSILVVLISLKHVLGMRNRHSKEWLLANHFALSQDTYSLILLLGTAIIKALANLPSVPVVTCRCFQSRRDRQVSSFFNYISQPTGVHSQVLRPNHRPIGGSPYSSFI